VKQAKAPLPVSRSDRPRPAGGRSPIASATTTAVAPRSWVPPVAIALLVALIGADVFRLGFFADDFHFLDVARRVPLLALLSGQYGLYPWYRPLSRELYFYLIAHSGPLGLVVAHTLSLLGVAGCAWLIHRLGAVLAGPRVASIAPLFFLAYAVTKFLAGWSSGFQDVLALLLVLMALRAWFADRVLPALLCAFLATFAKESAVVVFPLLALHLLLFPGRRRARTVWLGLAATLALSALLHLLVRQGWHSGGSSAQVERSLPALAVALARVPGDFVGRAPVLEPWAIGLALAAAATAAWWLGNGARAAGVASRARDSASAPVPKRQRLLFVAVAAALGLAPLVLGQLAGRLSAYEYYAFPAVPWLCLLLAMGVARLPRGVGNVAMTVLVAWNTLALGYRAPDLASADGWRFRNWDWAEAVRLSAVSRRLADDVRALVPERSDSLVVLFCDLRRGCYFQTEDGPATRESLHDETVRSYWLNAPAYPLPAGRIRIIGFDSNTYHLVPITLGPEMQGALAATAVAVGNAPAAWAFASAGDSAARAGFGPGYFRAAAALIAEGAAGASRALAGCGMADSTGPGPEPRAEQAVGRGSALCVPLTAVLRRPLDADAHLRLADAFRALGATLSEAVELRFVTALDPRRTSERLRLAEALRRLDLDDAARGEYGIVAARSGAAGEQAVARQALAELQSAPRADETESPLGEFEPGR